MPHKVEAAGFPGVIRRAAAIAYSCNAVRRLSDGRLEGDLFDDEGFVRGVLRKGLKLQAAGALVVGCGVVGSAIAASLTAVGVARLGLSDVHSTSAGELRAHLRAHSPAPAVGIGSNDPAGFGPVVNATPTGMTLATRCRWMFRASMSVRWMARS